MTDDKRKWLETIKDQERRLMNIKRLVAELKINHSTKFCMLEETIKAIESEVKK